MGAIASGGVQVVNEQVAGRLGRARPTCAGPPRPRPGAGQARAALPGGRPRPTCGEGRAPGRRRPGHRLDHAGGGGRRPPAGPGPGGGSGPDRARLHLPAPGRGGRRGGLRQHPAPVPGRRLLLPVVPQTSDEEVGRFSRPRGGSRTQEGGRGRLGMADLVSWSPSKARVVTLASVQRRKPGQWVRRRRSRGQPGNPDGGLVGDEHDLAAGELLPDGVDHGVDPLDHVDVPLPQGGARRSRSLHHSRGWRRMYQATFPATPRRCCSSR